MLVFQRSLELLVHADFLPNQRIAFRALQVLVHLGAFPFPEKGETDNKEQKNMRNSKTEQKQEKETDQEEVLLCF